MKTIRRGLSNVLFLALLVGLTVFFFALFSYANFGRANPNSSPLVTLTTSNVQSSPLPTPRLPNVPLGRIGTPVLLQTTAQVKLSSISRGKLYGVVNERETSYVAVFNLITGEERKLVDKTLGDAQVSNEWLVYIDESNVSTQAYYSRLKVLDSNTGREIILGNQDDIPQNPNISGDIVVWDESRNGKKSSVYGYNLATGKSFPIALGAGMRGYPHVSGQWVIYLQWPGSNPSGRESAIELRAHSLESGEDFLIGLIPAPLDSRFGTFDAIDGDKVVWTKYDADSQHLGEIHLYNLTSHTDRKLTGPNSWLPAGLSISAKSGIVVYNDEGRRIILDWLQPTPTPLPINLPAESSWGYELRVLDDYLVWQVFLDKDNLTSQTFVAPVIR